MPPGTGQIPVVARPYMNRAQRRIGTMQWPSNSKPKTSSDVSDHQSPPCTPEREPRRPFY